MKTFEQLNVYGKKNALLKARASIIESITEGILDIQLINPENQRKLDWIISQSIKNDNPRLAILRILGDKSICQEINKLAIIVVTETMYDINGNRLLEENLQ